MQAKDRRRRTLDIYGVPGPMYTSAVSNPVRKFFVQAAHASLQRVGLDVVRYPPRGEANLMRLLETVGVDLVLDVGANQGAYGAGLRRLGYRHRIVSFEPVSSAFAALKRRMHADPLWSAEQIALGRHAGMMTINVAANQAASSSFLPMLDRHVQSAPDAGYIRTEEVRVDTLASALDRYQIGARIPFVKLDVQGYEGAILDGADGALSRVAGLQLEMSLVPLYEGAPLYRDLIARLSGDGFALMGVSPGFSDLRTGQLLQFDGLFFRPF